MVVGVTGGSGFIGREVVKRHLERGDTVRILSRRHAGEVTGLPGEVEVVQADLATAHAPLQAFTRGLDVLYHCAGELRHESRMHALHVEGTRSLLAAAAGEVGRWVQLSSVGVYGPHRHGTVTEDAATDPRGTYELTKCQSDELVQDGAPAAGVELAMLRPAIVFGATMPNRSIAQMIRMIERGWFFFIGRQGASANYVEVSNVVDALILCGTRREAAGRVYNLSDWCTIEEFVGAICSALGASLPRLRLPEAPIRQLARLLQNVPHLPLTEARVDALVNRSRYAIDRIQRELGYGHRISIAEGLQRLVAAESAR